MSKEMMASDYSSGFGDGYRAADETVNVVVKWNGVMLSEFHGVSYSDVEKLKKESGEDYEFVVDSGK